MVALLGCSYFVGVTVGHVSNESHNDFEEQIIEIQTHNEQLEDQLGDTFEGVEGLLLNPDETYTFTISQDGRERNCSGTYEVNEEVASLVGDITCSYLVPKVSN